MWKPGPERSRKSFGLAKPTPWRSAGIVRLGCGFDYAQPAGYIALQQLTLNRYQPVSLRGLILNIIDSERRDGIRVMVVTSDTKLGSPALENGDRLTRDEFEIRYAAMPDLKKAELIEGVVYLASPVRAGNHALPHGNIMTWLGVYSVFTPGVNIYDNATVRLEGANEPQPDALLRIDENKGGSSRVGSDDYIEGAPELVVEIAASSASYDLYDKKMTYQRSGIQEYIVWNSTERTISWFVLRSGKYIALKPDESGITRSQVFPGLWLNVNALVAGKLVQVYETLQAGLSDSSHQAFVDTLSA